MSQPTEYQRNFSFTQYQIDNPSEPMPGTQLDSEFDDIKLTTDQIRSVIKLLQRDDGRLANGIVYYDSLSQEVKDAIAGEVVSGDGNGGGGTGGGGTVVGGDGVSFFRQLFDTPNSYNGKAYQNVRVNGTETGLEFFTPTDPELTFTDLTDTPSNIDNVGGYFLRVGEAGGFVEAVDINIEAGADYARLDEANDFSGNDQSNMVFKSYTEKVQAPAVFSGNQIIDVQEGGVIKGTVTGNINFALSDLPPNFETRNITVFMENAGAYSISWPVGTIWKEGSAPAFEATGWSVVTLSVFYDGTIFGFRGW